MPKKPALGLYQDRNSQHYQGVDVKPSRIPAAVIFDMDGLLFDTEALYQEAILMAATEGGHDISSGIFGQTIGRTWEQTRAILLDHFGAVFPVDEFITAWVRHFEVLSSDRQFLKPGVIELLDTLDDLRLPRAIATSSPHHTVHHHLTAHDLAGRFQTIVDHGDYASSKPAPDPFLKAAELLGVARSLAGFGRRHVRRGSEKRPPGGVR
jgi:beta-phosphoglucomutase-like phosphatase (HAD superfamily)